MLGDCFYKKKWKKKDINCTTIYNIQDVEATWMSNDTWMDKEVTVCVCMYGMYARKMNEIGSFAEKQMDLESVVQSEVSQKEK